MVSNLASVLRSGRPSTERGAVLPLMAIMLMVLLGSAAMAVDLAGCSGRASRFSTAPTPPRLPG